MHRSPWFTLVGGFMLGLVLGYVLAERQPVGLARSAATGPPAAGASSPARGDMPSNGGVAGRPRGGEATRFEAQLQELEHALEVSPGDARLMVALGNLNFDAGRWLEARRWYERSLEVNGSDALVLTDLAVVYHNLRQPERSLELLDRALSIAPDSWQALYNKAVVLHTAFERDDEARRLLERLEVLRGSDSAVPDLAALTAMLGGR